MKPNRTDQDVAQKLLMFKTRSLREHKLQATAVTLRCRINEAACSGVLSLKRRSCLSGSEAVSQTVIPLQSVGCQLREHPEVEKMHDDPFPPRGVGGFNSHPIA